MKLMRIYEDMQSRDIKRMLDQVNRGIYKPLPERLFNELLDDGWIDTLESEYNIECTIDDFEFLSLNISDNDRNGLKNFDEITVEKFNDFDIELKSLDKYPYNKLDFIDYDRGEVYIIRFKRASKK